LLEKILVVDDDPAQLRMMSSILNAGGLTTLLANNGREAVRNVVKNKPDMIILDLIMPELDGWQTCRLIRELSDVPILMLTGKCKSEEDIVRGLECGADSYIYKPVGNRELLARIKSALRRVEKSHTGDILKKGIFSNDYLTVDVPERKVLVNGVKLKLTPREFRVLALLVENAGRTLSHKQVLENVWGFEYAEEVEYVRIYVAHLRQKIEPEPSIPRYILTEPGIGYYFCSAN
jgi:two-component system KDP operon response regulator KdpE